MGTVSMRCLSPWKTRNARVHGPPGGDVAARLARSVGALPFLHSISAKRVNHRLLFSRVWARYGIWAKRIKDRRSTRFIRLGYFWLGHMRLGVQSIPILLLPPQLEETTAVMTTLVASTAPSCSLHRQPRHHHTPHTTAFGACKNNNFSAPALAKKRLPLLASSLRQRDQVQAKAAEPNVEGHDADVVDIELYDTTLRDGSQQVRFVGFDTVNSFLTR
jgi:hypothetical protein